MRIWSFAPPLLAAVTVAVTVALFPAGQALAGGPGTWTKISVTDSGFNQAGLLRTGDGALHLIWRKRLSNGNLGYGWSTVSGAGKLLASGTALSNWVSMEGDPRLVPSGTGLRLIFIGGQDTNPSNFFSRGALYTMTSTNGSSWTLVHGTISQHTVLNLGLGAVNDAGGTPVAIFGLNNVLWFHRGVDPSAPAAAPDGTAGTGPVDTGLNGPALVRDSKGTVWAGWSDNGYWARPILPSAGTAKKAPGSGTGSPDNSPRQQVALAARAGGGVFLAYCAPVSSNPCGHIDLWRVGAARALTVPGSATGNGRLVALAAGPGGRLWVAWYDVVANVIHAVRTNAAGSAFGTLRTIKPPPATFIFNGLQGEGSKGPLDVVVNVLLNQPGNPIEFWHTQILPALKMTAKPASFSHTSATTVTFTVTDAGDGVAGATVSCLGKSGTTNGSGQVKLTFGKGTQTGKHTCTATMKGYLTAKTAITVT
jgi:hypothetical protein